MKPNIAAILKDELIDKGEGLTAQHQFSPHRGENFRRDIDEYNRN